MKTFLIEKCILWLLGIKASDFTLLRQWVASVDAENNSGPSKKSRVVMFARGAIAYLFKPDGTPTWALNAAVEFAVALLRRTK